MILPFELKIGSDNSLPASDTGAGNELSLRNDPLKKALIISSPVLSSSLQNS
jgi:hypothetical protein